MTTCSAFTSRATCEPRELGLLYYVIVSSETLADALAKAARYGSIANEGVAIAFARAAKPQLACAM